MIISLCLIIPIVLSIVNDVNSIPSGVPAVPGQYPYVVSIWTFCDHTCSGTIIDEKHILTAAHCVSDEWLLITLVLIGLIDWQPDVIKEFYRVKSFHRHPLYEQFTLVNRFSQFSRHDIAVITLEEAITFDVPSFRIGPAIISNFNIFTDDITQEYEIPAWEYVREHENDPVVLYLLRVDVKIFSEGVCFLYGEILFENQLCASYKNNDNIVKLGNSGSPIIRWGQVVGILTAGPDGPASRALAIVLRILPYMSWITDTIAANP